MEILWPIKQTKYTAHFKDGNKELKLRIERKGNKTKVFREGDEIKKILNWNVFYTINLEEVEFVN